MEGISRILISRILILILGTCWANTKTLSECLGRETVLCVLSVLKRALILGTLVHLLHLSLMEDQERLV